MSGEKLMTCPIGKYSTSASGICTECEAGYYNDKEGQISCDTPCVAGKYSLKGASFCQQCPAGRYSNQSGLSSGDDCILAQAGKYANASIEVLPCAIGKYQDETEQTSCKLCSAGTYTFCLLYTSPSPRDLSTSRMPSSA